MFLATDTMLAMHRALRADRLAALPRPAARETTVQSAPTPIRIGRTVAAR